eukprot:TRINITY_DN11328_c0_g1_i1.p1 TRINITY_DN11328_c0_g1~~TRINITY_DN11328_c0_g1_i1.p1  ORF type:complete len:325 (-),score=61.90 TRINITY_DN11328_c0_g1_i1:65-1006(-)
MSVRVTKVHSDDPEESSPEASYTGNQTPSALFPSNSRNGLQVTPSLSKKRSGGVSPRNSPKDEPQNGSIYSPKANSTSTFHINSTLHSPNATEVIKSLATALSSHLVADQKVVSNSKLFDIFDETKHPLDKKLVPAESSNHVDEIFFVLNQTLYPLLQFEKKIPVEVGIVALVYIERLIATSKIVLQVNNYRRVILAAIMLACKVWVDQPIYVSDFATVYRGMTLEDLNTLENSFIALIGYDLEVTSQLYAKYYFDLRSVSEKEKRQWTGKILDKEIISRMELRSVEQTKVVKRGARRAMSVQTDSSKDSDSP